MDAGNQKRAFMATARQYHGKWYLWGGDDPTGFDCSGFVVECLKACGKLLEKEDYTADGLWDMFKGYRITNPKEGAIVFYFNENDKATHVGICVDHDFCLNADGGNSKTKTIQDAIKQNAFIKIRPINKRKAKRSYVYLF